MVPLVVMASTESRLRIVDPMSMRWWVTTSMLQAVILVAYAASSLPKWANWIDGTRLDRLTIVQSVLISLLAGNVAWVLAYHYAVAHEAVAWATAVVAAYGGDAYLSRRLSLLFGPGKDEPLT